MSTRKQLGEQIALVMQEVIASAVLTNERIARSIGLNVVDFQTWVHAVQFYDARIDEAYDAILRQMGEVHARFSVAELQTVVRYLEEIKQVR